MGIRAESRFFGHRTQTGNFQLEIAIMPDNVQCSDAVEVASFSSRTFGTTVGVTDADADWHVLGDILGGGVWFRTALLPSFDYIVYLETMTTGFKGEIALLTFSNPLGDCSASTFLVRSIFSDLHTRITPDSDAEYFIFVRPKEGEANGDFVLVVEEEIEFSPRPAPDNAFCSGALLFDRGITGHIREFYRASYLPALSPPSCGNEVFGTALGVWYQLNITVPLFEDRLPVTASTCNSQTDFDTQLSVFRGACNELECVDGNDQDPACGDSSTISFFVESGWIYFIYVLGYSDRRGTFELSVDEEVGLTVGNQCNIATEIEPYGSSTLGSTDTLSTTTTAITCNNIFAPGVEAWYHLVGTGDAMIASTCHPSTSFVAVVSVYAGSDCNSLECVQNAVYYPCEDGQTAVSWTTIDQEDYYILVHGNVADSFGGFFVLTVDTATDNNSCEDAIGPLEIALPGVPKTFGSTRGATIENNVKSCSGDAGRGLWYIVEGTGTDMIATTCSEYTTFDARVSVFLGDGCPSSLECLGPEMIIPSFSACVAEGTISWRSRPGEEYLILVQGLSAGGFGNFELQVSSS
jgi:hypothetical protein